MAKGRKTGGRQKGSKNKVSSSVRDIISRMVGDYYNSDQFARDLADLDAKDRVSAMEKFVAYIVPKLQSTSLDVAEETRQTIEDRLRDLAEIKD